MYKSRGMRRRKSPSVSTSPPTSSTFFLSALAAPRTCQLQCEKA